MLKYPYCHQNDHANPSKGGQKGFGKSRIFENFHVPLNRLNKAVPMVLAT